MKAMLSARERDMIAAMKPVFAVSILAAAALLAGCGGKTAPKGNGEASKTATQVVADALTAAGAATSVHVAGSGTTGGSPLALDLFLVADKGGKGSISVSGLTFDIVRIGDTAYFKGDSAFWEHFGGKAVAQLLKGRWLKASATSGELASFTPLTDIAKLFASILTSSNTLVNQGETDLDGVKTVAILDTKKGGTLYVAATGTPYPVALKKKGSGDIAFTSWNEPVTLTAPADAVDASQLGG